MEMTKEEKQFVYDCLEGLLQNLPSFGSIGITLKTRDGRICQCEQSKQVSLLTVGKPDTANMETLP